MFTGGDPAPPDAVVVCTGLGTRFLGGVEDMDLYPTRGQTVVVRAPWVRFGITVADANGKLTYVIPRKSGDVRVLAACNLGADKLLASLIFHRLSLGGPQSMTIGHFLFRRCLRISRILDIDVLLFLGTPTHDQRRRAISWSAISNCVQSSRHLKYGRNGLLQSRMFFPLWSRKAAA